MVRPLPRDYSLEQAFARLSRLRGCLWLDSAVSGPTPIGRFSFLTADPVETLRCESDDPAGWATMQRWMARFSAAGLPATASAELPPFQGGIAGLWGYDAGAWLEDWGRPQAEDLPTAPIVLGLYDWVLAYDHALQRGWLIAQGLPETAWDRRLRLAARRIDQVTAWLEAPPLHATDGYASGGQPQGQHPTDRGGALTSNFRPGAFREAVAEVVARIRRGDSFQVNLAQRLVLPQQATSSVLYRRLRATNPAPMAGYFDAGDFQVLSSSPEGFLRVDGRQVETRPIKGTASRTGDADEDGRLAKQLAASEKDRAENVMIVDLMRNDLARCCDDHSVRVEQLCRVEPYAFVQHLVSVVRGTLRSESNVPELLASCFPGGSITGAPKVEAMRTIRELEPHRRGPYCGSLGYLSCGGQADFNILIRTATATQGWLQLPVGGGVTAKSDPRAEEAETWQKAKGMLKALQ